MDALTFITELAKAFAWPVALVIPALVFRKPLIELIPALRRLRFKEFEIEFGRELLEAETYAKGTQTSPHHPAVAEKMLPIRLQQIAEVAPSAAILECWKDVEAAAVNLATNKGFSATGSPWELFRTLKSQGFLSLEQATILEHLRKLRNKAVHESETVVTQAQALRYAAMAIVFAEDLRSLVKQGN